MIYSELDKLNVTITGERVHLASLKKIDIELLRKWRNQDNIRSNYIYREIISYDQQRTWWNQYKDNKNDYTFIIRHNDNNENIGAVALYNINGNVAEFGRLMIPEEKNRGNGFALEACSLILQFAFQRLSLQKLYLRVLSHNENAKKLYKRLKFIPTHEEANIEFHELYAREWSRRDNSNWKKFCKKE